MRPFIWGDQVIKDSHSSCYSSTAIDCRCNATSNSCTVVGRQTDGLLSCQKTSWATRTYLYKSVSYHKLVLGVNGNSVRLGVNGNSVQSESILKP